MLKIADFKIALDFKILKIAYVSLYCDTIVVKHYFH